jgi:phosphatidylserine/phosphatidylglycerophosphate/cardiolipin synthase-like enzyme
MVCVVGAGLLVREIVGNFRQQPSAREPAQITSGSLIQDTSVRTCFTPARSCVGLIVDALSRARSEIRVQAYGFTSKPILSALVAAKVRGVDVVVILDKSDERALSIGGASYAFRSGIPVFIDYQPRIAHNKVIIIDRVIVLTGSYNFTASAERSNAENITVVTSPSVAGQFLANWESRRAASRKFAEN